MDTTSNPLNPSFNLLVKLGSIIVHVNELFSVDGRVIDKEALLHLLVDIEVQTWIKAMGPLVPLKRR